MKVLGKKLNLMVIAFGLLALYVIYEYVNPVHEGFDGSNAARIVLYIFLGLMGILFLFLFFGMFMVAFGS